MIGNLPRLPGWSDGHHQCARHRASGIVSPVAHATSMNVDWKHGIIIVWMVQHAGFPFDGGNAQDVFKKASVSNFGTGQ